MYSHSFKMLSLEECKLLAEDINACMKSSGCLSRELIDKSSYKSLEDYLKFRPPWNPNCNKPADSVSKCTNTSLPFCSSMDLASSSRYSPQCIALDECSKSIHSGTAHQSISSCAVLVVGAGGLGSPVLMYLASAGIGLIGIMDGDVVELSNLHRQIIHDEENIGMNKAVSARKRLLKMNSTGCYLAYEFYFGEKEAHEILPLYDIIVDASDNPQTKYLLNDACVLYNKSLIIASCIRSQGQLLVINRIDGDADVPCFRCICPFEGNSLVTLVKNACSSAGVLGSIPGIIGTLQATEVLKMASGATECNIKGGRLLIYDAANPLVPFKTLKLTKNPSCTVCSEDKSKLQLKMYESVDCGLNLLVDEISISMENFWSLYMDSIMGGVPVRQTLRLKVCPGDLLVRDDNGRVCDIYMLDVRPSAHYFISHLPSAINWPVRDLLNSSCHEDVFVEELNKRIKVTKGYELVLLVMCIRGNSSRVATNAINKFKLPNVHCYSVTGGYQYIKKHLNLQIPVV